MLKLRAVAVGSVFAMISMVGCGGGVSEKTLDDIQARIDVLTTKGLPDDSISGTKVHIYQAREHLKKGNNAMAKKSVDSLNIYMERADNFYNTQVATLGPTIDAAKAKATAAKAELTGYQVRKIDSTLKVIDSIRGLDWLLKANGVAQELVALLPSLAEDEAKSKNLRKVVPGEWYTETITKSVEHKIVNAKETKLFTFFRDGRVNLLENKKGYSGPYLHEDWEFRSYGTYDFKGDTIMLSISRFHIVKQRFKRLHLVEGKEIWKDEPQPEYDSTITDGSQDRFVTYDDLKEDFKRRKAF